MSTFTPLGRPRTRAAPTRHRLRMTGVLLLEQVLNGLQFGLMLFLLAAGLTLVFGVMDMINLAHGSLYMVGAFLAAWLVGADRLVRARRARRGRADRRCSAWRSKPGCCARCTCATTCRRCWRRSR